MLREWQPGPPRQPRRLDPELSTLCTACCSQLYYLLRQNWMRDLEKKRWLAIKWRSSQLPRGGGSFCRSAERKSERAPKQAFGSEAQMRRFTVLAPLRYETPGRCCRYLPTAPRVCSARLLSSGSKTPCRQASRSRRADRLRRPPHNVDAIRRATFELRL